jgi:hypothetical protein
MKHELIIKEEAKFEVLEAYNYYENANRGLGDIFLEYLEKCFDRIISNPLHFPIRRKPYREALVEKFPFLVIYELIDTKVIVYSVFNTWRNPLRKP